MFFRYVFLGLDRNCRMCWSFLLWPFLSCKSHQSPSCSWETSERAHILSGHFSNSEPKCKIHLPSQINASLHLVLRKSCDVCGIVIALYLNPFILPMSFFASLFTCYLTCASQCLVLERSTCRKMLWMSFGMVNNFPQPFPTPAST